MLLSLVLLSVYVFQSIFVRNENTFSVFAFHEIEILNLVLNMNNMLSSVDDTRVGKADIQSGRKLILDASRLRFWRDIFGFQSCQSFRKSCTFLGSEFSCFESSSLCFRSSWETLCTLDGKYIEWKIVVLQESVEFLSSL